MNAPSDAVGRELTEAESLYLAGAELAERGDYEGAAHQMSEALALQPDLTTARFQLGLLLLTMAQPDGACAVWAPLESLPDRAPLRLFKQGLEALIVDDFESCVALLQQGIDLNPDNEALNRDMHLVINRVHETTSGPVPPDSGDLVRTDFSLYRPGESD